MCLFLTSTTDTRAGRVTVMSDSPEDYITHGILFTQFISPFLIMYSTSQYHALNCWSSAFSVM